MTTPGAVMFDVDGTLVDTNWFHTLSWWRTLRDGGHQVEMARIHPLIGMGSDKLLTELLGHAPAELREAHSEQFAPFKREIVAFAKAGELLGAVARRGVKVVLATSSKESDLGEMLAALDADDAIAGVVHADMVDASKPSPDVFATAIDHFGLDPGRSAVVGDTRWDVEAAAALGLPCVAVLTGGTTRAELEAAGAVAVYADAAELLDRLDDSPIARLFS